MCDTCGCGQPGDEVIIRKPGEHNHAYVHDGVKHNHSHDHSHSGEEHTHAEHDHTHHHHPDHTHGAREIVVEENILQKNDLLAEHNRGFFEAKGMVTLNLVSSPGSGKTTLLEKTISALNNRFTFAVIEGDQQTMNDANRINATGAPVVQINTGNGCHLDASMINSAVMHLDVPDKSFLMIENVGNLVCPALFDLGEAFRVVIISVTEGDDKPVKYPTMFQTADLCLINKTDLLPYVDFDVEKAKEYAHRINPQISFISLSAQTGEGMDEWFTWLEEKMVTGTD
ncbi:MAG: hydrogenase nickel incorporation protein HypB [Chlorobi bacterium]|nr:hydrogenase nickel incorporation protein HypB [Chlorobiota bacterium]